MRWLLMLLKFTESCFSFILFVKEMEEPRVCLRIWWCANMASRVYVLKMSVKRNLIFMLLRFKKQQKRITAWLPILSVLFSQVKFNFFQCSDCKVFGNINPFYLEGCNHRLEDLFPQRFIFLFRFYFFRFHSVKIKFSLEEHDVVFNFLFTVFSLWQRASQQKTVNCKP